MKKTNRIVAVIAAVAVMLVTCLTAAGCGDFSPRMDSYAQTSQPQETLSQGQSIYDLSIFDDLPRDYSDIDPAFWVAEGNGGKVYNKNDSDHLDDTHTLLQNPTFTGWKNICAQRSAGQKGEALTARAG